ncbi:MAG: DUF5681 domain-containing protein [Verrucomicrobiales bacterium]
MNKSSKATPIEAVSLPNGDVPGRTPKGQFQPGRSGNPTGRPREESTALRQKLLERAEDVVQAVISAAISGDMAAAKMILDRLIPALRPHSAPVDVPLDGAMKPAQAACTILGEAMAGRISPDAAAQLLNAAADLARLIEAEEIKPRIEALERAITIQNAKAKKPA